MSFHDDSHVFAIDPQQAAAKAAPTVKGAAQFEPCLMSSEALEMLPANQRPVETGRAHFKHIRARKGIFHVQMS